MAIDLNKIQTKIDYLLENDSAESVTRWFQDRRNKRATNKGKKASKGPQDYNIEIEILKASHYAHGKANDELARFLPELHPRRVEIRKHTNDIGKQIKLLSL